MNDHWRGASSQVQVGAQSVVVSYCVLVGFEL
jgi:hypothetical protein